MRKYINKQDRQKKSYHTDRFYKSPTLPKLTVSSNSTFAMDLNSLQNVVEVQDAYIQAGHLVIYINHKNNKKAISHLKDIRAYDFMIELSAIDYIKDQDGFEIFYELLSTTKRARVRLKCFLQKEKSIQSVYDIFAMANWSEREMFDMYGIKIKNHPYMKRILMPDDWHDYPLLKRYPLTGDEQASWYEVDQIFGKENRDKIGAELRDSAQVDRYDTNRFARLGHEVPKGVDITSGEPETPIRYQEDGGSLLVTKFDKKPSKILDKRK
ncbi:MAG: NADH dehydrogenase [Campylobacteraceae bacterium 4484_166]|nr:MAG: NADH dehydrogenase [Campylobacteraceae bacterium 4484_166]